MHRHPENLYAWRVSAGASSAFSEFFVSISEVPEHFDPLLPY